MVLQMINGKPIMVLFNKYIRIVCNTRAIRWKFCPGKSLLHMKRMGNRPCVFCGIIQGTEPGNIQHRDNELIVFDDKYPEADVHLLVCSIQCLRSIRALNTTHIPMVRRMRELGIEMLSKRNLSLDDAILGFHVPPSNSVNHLHMHVISPRSKMSSIKRFIFDQRYYHFKSVDKLIKELEQRAEHEA